MRIAALLAALVVAYGAGFVADGALNDDGCMAPTLRETDRIEETTHWFPISTDCRAYSRGGRLRGSATTGTEVFMGTFVGTLVIAFALLLHLARLVRLVVIVGAVLGAGYVIFA